jgi:hypothetical protein
MNKIAINFVVALLIISVLIPTRAFANDVSKVIKIDDIVKSTTRVKPFVIESRRIQTKADDPSCFVDIFRLGNTTSMTLGNGVTQAIKHREDGRLESVTTNGRTTAISYEGPRATAKVLGITSHEGIFFLFNR